MGSAGKFFRSLFRVFILVGFIWFVAAGGIIDNNEGAKTSKTPSSSRGPKYSPRAPKHVKVVGVDELRVLPPDSDLNYMSKRKVPNGPDPIHNRRAGNSGRTPGRA